MAPRMFFTIFTAIAFILVCFSFREPKITEAGELDTMSGWLWSSNAGWISLNDLNCTVDNCDVYGIDYGASVRPDSKVIGEAWSENFGWICFGETCGDWGTGNAPDGNPPAASFDGVKFLGWANIRSLGSEGWFKLQGPAVSTAGKTGASCFDCYYEDETKCRSCFTEISSQNYGLVGDVCYDCLNCATSSLPYTCAGCASCNNYGLMVDSDAKQIYGWAWGGFSDNKGVGWIKAYEFNALYSPFSWLEAKYGNIYSQKEISASPAPPGRYNATYCIQASGILTSFSTANGCVLTATPGYEEILFPDQANLYTNVLGKIDLTGIISGKYGEVEIIKHPSKTEFKSADLIGNLTSSCKLNKKIYHVKGSLTLDNPAIEFCNSLDGGNGVIVVDGDLTIEKNLSYDAGSVTKISNLASVGWIIGGDMRIDGSVEQVVGGFYVEGGNGVSTGESAVPLTIYGLMIAKKYAFEREYESINRGSEQIIYDGRALINTPPGMEDLTKALPLYKEAAP